MKHKQKFLNIKVGTFEQIKNNLILKLDRTRFQFDRIEELNALKQQEYPFLELKQLSEQGKSVVFQYKVPNEAKNLKSILREPKAIRTAIALAILKQDILARSPYHVSLNPSNIWYYPMKRVWYAYRANELMPFDEEKDLPKYKAVVLFCLTGVPYEKLLVKPEEALGKNNDELLKQVIATTSIIELTEVLEDINDFVSTSEWQTIAKKEADTKKKSKIMLASTVILALVLIGAVHSLDAKKYHQLKIENIEQVKAIKVKSKIDSLLSSKNFKEADKAMKESDYSPEQRYEIFSKVKEYQLALNAKPSHVLDLVSLAYKDNAKDILDWKLPDNATQKEKNALAFEKSILNYDEDKLQNQLPFIEDEDVLTRLGSAFTSHENFDYAEQTLTKLSEKDKEKGTQLKHQINYKKAQLALDKAENAKKEADKIDGKKDKNKDGKVKEANSNLDMAKKDLEKAKKELDN